MELNSAEELYYYTTVETMKFILTDGNIYATNVRYLNDSDEYINGLRELKNLLNSAKKLSFGSLLKYTSQIESEKIFNRIYEEVSNIYSISFSKARDLLSQWHMYAKESGIQIKMYFREGQAYNYYLKGQQSEGKEKDEELRRKPVYYLTQIGMPQKEYRETGKKVLADIQNMLSCSDKEGEFIEVWKNMAPYIKNYGFLQEQEVRAVFFSNRADFPVCYRNDNGVLKPYLDVRMKEGWPICRITVGPGKNQNKVYQSVCHFLAHSAIRICRVPWLKLIDDYFDGMLEYQLPQKKIATCKNKVLENEPELAERLGVRYSEMIHDELEKCNFTQVEREIVNQYLMNNYFCDKGIIVDKSKWPYEF